jgi:hypothetical protein
MDAASDPNVKVTLSSFIANLVPGYSGLSIFFSTLQVFDIIQKHLNKAVDAASDPNVTLSSSLLTLLLS